MTNVLVQDSANPFNNYYHVDTITNNIPDIGIMNTDNTSDTDDTTNINTMTNIDYNIVSNLDQHDAITQNIIDNTIQNIQHNNNNLEDIYNLIPQDIDNTIAHSMDILTNLISDINNICNIENLVDSISTNELQQLQRFLLEILTVASNSRNIYGSVLQWARTNYQIYQVTLDRRTRQLTQQVTDLRESLTPDAICCICNEHPRTFVNIVCGHMCSCENCTNRLNNTCPICRTEGTFIRVIRS